MSVHGEYERALEHVILQLRPLPSDPGETWIEAFGALRMRHQPDLSTAARSALALIERFQSETEFTRSSTERAKEGGSDRPQGNILEETTSHLRAHCEAILGVSAQNRA